MGADLRPLVSIVTPSFNQAQFLEEAIRSVLNQTYPRIEYIVIDGGSADGSVDILRKYADRLAYWVSERDAGQSDAINKGFRRATGDIVAWLNSDDYYLPHAVETVVQFLGEHAEIGMVYGDMDLIDAHGYLLPRRRWHAFDLAGFIVQDVVIPQPAAFWRRKVFAEVGELRTDLHYAMDHDLWLRIGRRYPIAHLPATLARFRFSGVSKTTAQPGRFVADLVKILDELYAGPVSPEIAHLEGAAYSAAYLNGAAGSYSADDPKTARRWLLRALRRHPRTLLTRKFWSIGARSLLSPPIVRVARRLRVAARRRWGAKATPSSDVPV